MEKTYWYGNGKFQKDYDDIWERLIPGSGPALTHAGEVFRAMGRLYYSCNLARFFNRIFAEIISLVCQIFPQISHSTFSVVFSFGRIGVAKSCSMPFTSRRFPFPFRMTISYRQLRNVRNTVIGS